MGLIDAAQMDTNDLTSDSDSNGVFDATLNAAKFAFTSHVEGANTTFDFGFIESRVGDFLWAVSLLSFSLRRSVDCQDANANGLQDVGELPVVNATVELVRRVACCARVAQDVFVRQRSAAGALLASTLTDASGRWSFATRANGLVAGGNYTVRVPLTGPLANAQPTTSRVGANQLRSTWRLARCCAEICLQNDRFKHCARRVARHCVV